MIPVLVSHSLLEMALNTYNFECDNGVNGSAFFEVYAAPVVSRVLWLYRLDVQMCRTWMDIEMGPTCAQTQLNGQNEFRHTFILFLSDFRPNSEKCLDFGHYYWTSIQMDIPSRKGDDSSLPLSAFPLNTRKIKLNSKSFESIEF